MIDISKFGENFNCEIRDMLVFAYKSRFDGI